MSIIGPLLFAGLMVVPVWLTQLEDKEPKKIAVVEIDEFGRPVPDSTMILRNVFENKPLLKFDYLGEISVAQAEELAIISDYFGVLIVRHRAFLAGDKVSVELIAKKQPSFGIEMQIEQNLETFLYNKKLLTYNVPPQVINNLNTKVSIAIRRADENEIKSSGDINVKRGLGYISGFLIYMFIFFFGAQVMRGVVEEKSNRIIEVIITSVKPFQLMMGKIIGIGLVGLTQFVTWIILSLVIFQFAESYMLNEKLHEIQNQQQTVELFNTQPATQQNTEISMEDVELSGMFESLREIDFLFVLCVFVFYFITGFLLYASMFAAIGAAVDSETDTQQFMLPVTIPLVIGIIVMMNAITNPEGSLAYWFSIIPFTSPIVMMARIGFDIPVSELILSASLLILTFIFMTWLSGKIYRIGILMYGKKTSYKEIIKWIRYK